MAAVAFILGGVAGIIGAIATLVLTEAGWGAALKVYFLLGYGVPILTLIPGLLHHAAGGAAQPDCKEAPATRH